MIQTIVSFRPGRLAVVVTIVILFTLTGCKSEAIEGHWQEQTMAVDGKIDDWEGVPTSFFEKQETVVAMCSDSSNLYILFRFRNPAWAKAIRMGGLMLWIDNDGGSDKTFGVRYNGAPEIEFTHPEGADMPEGMASGGRMDRFSQMMEEKPVHLLLIDKNSIFQEAIIPADGREGPAVACDTSMSFFTYEFKIPLMKSELNYYGIDASPGRKISVGALWGGMERQRGMSAGMEGPPMGGGRPGGGGGGRPGGKMSGDRQPGGMEEQEVWLTTTLATSMATTKVSGE